jgi:hypothetical protein
MQAEKKGAARKQAGCHKTMVAEMPSAIGAIQITGYKHHLQ